MTSDADPIPDGRLELSRLKARVDVSRVFCTYLAAGGDRFRTAAATGLTVEEVSDLANDEGWAAKLAERTKLADGTDKTLADVNREVGRLTAAAMSQRVIDEINGVLLYLEKLTPEEKAAFMFEVDRTGKRTPTASFYVELAKALEIAQQCLYRANEDQLPMRPEAADAEAIGKGMGLGIGKAFAELAGKNAPAPPKPKKVGVEVVG